MRKEIYNKGNLEITRGFDFGYEVMQYHENFTLIFSLIYFTIFLRLPERSYDWENWDRSWGVRYHDSAIWFHWGAKMKVFHMPWDWEHVRHEVMFKDGLRVPPGEPWETNDGRIVETFPYLYVLKNDEPQERNATIHTEEREWRWRWFTWLPFPRKIRRSISVDFDGEVGEKSGSWKGGVLGCGYDMFPGETPHMTLQRMQAHRIFN